MRRAPLTALVALGTLALGTSLAAQPAPIAPRRVEGRVLVQRDSAAAPVVGTWVTVHRVASDTSGPLDSVRTDAQGRYAIDYHAFGSDDAIYFASTRYGGVAYFTRPLRGARVSGPDAQLDVFDTTSTPIRVTVRGRHFIVSGADPRGARSVVEVYELSNDTSVTVIEREGSSKGVWSVPLSRDARDFQVREGEIPVDALVARDGRAALHMPLSPGLKQIAFSYTLPDDAFPLSVPNDALATVFEVLIEDPRAKATGGRVVAVDPVTVEGRAFHRFLAQDVPAGTSLVVDVTHATPGWVRWVVPGVLAVLGVGMIGVLAWAAERRRPRVAVPAPVLAHDDAESIARRIAALDDAFQNRVAPDADARVTYERERGALKARLAAALAARAGTR